MLNISKDFAPPLNTVLPYFLASCISGLFCIVAFFNISLPINFSNLFVIGTVHLFFVGFLLMLFVGAMIQLMPVVLETAHVYLWFYKYIFYAFMVGLVCLVVGFWNFNFFIFIGGILVFLAIIFYLVDLFSAMGKKFSPSFLSVTLLISHILLSFGLVCGLLMALGLGGIFDVDFSKFLILHMDFAISGFMFNLIVVISLILLPMFSLAHGFSNIYSKISVCLFSVSPIFIIINLNQLAFVGIFIGVVFYLLQIFVIYKKRVRKENDIWFKSILVSFFSLIFAILCWLMGRVDLLFFILGFGFFGFLVSGHIYKIVPFLVWFEYYAPLVGKQKVPMLHQMIPIKESNMQFYFSLLGLMICALAMFFESNIVFNAGLSFLSVGWFFLIYSVLKISKKEI